MLNNLLHPNPEDVDVFFKYYKGSWRYVVITGKWDHPAQYKDENGK